MTAEKMTRTTYVDPNSGLPRSGSTARGESRVDVEQYAQPLERVHAAHAHGWGIADGLRVTAALGEAELRILPGVALDVQGRHISLAPDGLALIGAGPPVEVPAEGLPLPTSGITGERYLTIGFAETFDAETFTDSQFTVFQFDHTPMIELHEVDGFAGDGTVVVLARVALDQAGIITQLNQDGRRGVAVPAEAVRLRRALAFRELEGPAAGVGHEPSAEVRARPAGGLELRVSAPTDEIDLGRDGGSFARLSIAAERVLVRRNDGTGTLAFETEAGNLGIGAGTVPLTALHLPERGLQIGTSGTDTDNFYLASDTHFAGQRGLRLYQGNHGNGTHLLTVSSGGRVGVGTADPRARLDVRATRTGVGLAVISERGAAVTAFSEEGIGLQASSGGATPVAARFLGNVTVTGTLSKQGGQFKIDHPLDPANRYLCHSFVESAEMKNVYDGVVELDAAGEAEIALEDWCEALNERFRYQLTAIGGPAPNLHIAREVSGNTFTIAGGEPGMRVSWQVTGVRHDRYALAHPLVVEEDKSPEQRGYYLSPDLYDQPPERSIEWAREPRGMRLLALKQARVAASARRGDSEVKP